MHCEGNAYFMVSEVYVSEETVALAKEKACEMLGVTEDKVEFEVLQFPSKKVLGVFGGKQAQIKASVKQKPSQKAVEFLKEVFFYIGLKDLSLEIQEENEEYCSIKIDDENNPDNIGYIVGKHGDTLDALQYLASLAVNEKNNSEKFCKVRLEAGNYREKRKQTLEEVGKRFADKAVSLGKKVNIEPMRSYERKIVHDAISKLSGVKSWSEGDGENRHVVVAPASDVINEM